MTLANSKIWYKHYLATGNKEAAEDMARNRPAVKGVEEPVKEKIKKSK